MKSSVKGLIGVVVLSVFSTTIYHFWKEDQLEKIEARRSWNLKCWNQVNWDELVILGLWSDKQLKLIESSGSYFLTVSEKKISSDLKLQDQGHRYSGKEVMGYLKGDTYSVERSYLLKGLTYLGNKGSIKKVQVVKDGSYLLELRDSLKQNLWWFHQKDPKGKIVFFFDKKIISVFLPKGFLMEDQIRLKNIHNFFNLDKIMHNK